MMDGVLAWAHVVLREESTYRDDERGRVANDGRVGRKEGERRNREDPKFGRVRRRRNHGDSDKGVLRVKMKKPPPGLICSVCNVAVDPSFVVFV